MEVKELRIGNYIERHNKVTGVKDIVQVDGGTPLLAFEGMTTLKFNPIPLTDDYFDVISGRERMITYFDVADDCKHSLVFEIDHDGNYYYTGGEGVKMSRTIQYVHELQNLAWELERAEITFK